jgi:Uma2 family endonuclease
MRAVSTQKPGNGPPNKTAGRGRAPWLLNGDHLTVPEFERRYEALAEDERFELIEGIVVMSPPISSEHGKANSMLDWLLRHYSAATPRTAVAVNTSIRMDGKNEYQPDIMLWIESGSRARMAAGGGALEGRPELVAEIALSSSSYDRHEKKAVYQRNQVPEYIIWEVMDARIEWFMLENGEYALSTGRADGVHCSRIFPGLWLNLRALLDGDNKKAIGALNRGIQSAAHKALVKQLAKS